MVDGVSNTSSHHIGYVEPHIYMSLDEIATRSSGLLTEKENDARVAIHNRFAVSAHS